MKLHKSLFAFSFVVAAFVLPHHALAQDSEKATLAVSLDSVNVGLSDGCKGDVPALVTTKIKVGTGINPRNLVLVQSAHEGAIEFWRVNTPSTGLRIDANGRDLVREFCAPLGFKIILPSRVLEVTTGNTSAAFKVVVAVPGK